MSSDAIKVTVKYLVSVADKTGRRREEISLPPGTTLKGFSEWLGRERGISLPDPRILTVLNGRGWDQHPDKAETRLADGDTILLFPPIAGG
jgi:molybdopterin converting factor small subunit